MSKKTFKKNKGITLIALVVTIIVLLILAGISISMLTGQNGILNRTHEAKEKTSEAKQKEEKEINNYEKTIEQYISDLPSTKYTKPYLPDSTKFEQIKGTSLNTGLVIKEKETGNEYVWVEVPRSEEVYKTVGINLSSFGENEYRSIENDLQVYTKVYRNGTQYKDEFFEDESDGWFKNDKEYNDLKYKMLESIYQNGGFWVGRYEAGTDQQRISNETTSEEAKSKANLYPYTYITRTQAKNLAEKNESGNYTSSLMFGIQWDLMLAFLHNTGKIEDDVLIKDSTQVGNYYNNLWNIVNENAKYSLDDGNNFFSMPYEKKENKTVLITTGANKNFSMMNIFDIAGNVWEWTLESTLNKESPCVCMAGSYGTGGNFVQVNFRNGSNATDFVHCSVGFRVSIF